MKVAVLDFGKTNSKLFVFGQDGRILDERRTQPKWVRKDGFSVLDEAALHDWALGAVSEAVESHGVEGVMVSGHGCTFALVDEAALTHPILDYEQEPPAEIAAQIDRRIPDFAETFSPRLPLGFNYGRHMLWLQEVDPDAFAAAKSILGYPQYWSWRLGGGPVSEVSYLGCHSHLWAPRSRDFSSLVDAEGWRGRMPAFARAGAVIGERQLGGAARPVAIHNGVHDSMRRCMPIGASSLVRLTVVSTGTWVVVLNPDCPLDVLDRERDIWSMSMSTAARCRPSASCADANSPPSAAAGKARSRMARSSKRSTPASWRCRASRRAGRCRTVPVGWSGARPMPENARRRRCFTWR